jgi:uncharacterized membrane protein YfcA
MNDLVAFVIGFTAALIGAIASGGGLISIPGLIFLGITPVSAIATTRLNLMTGGLSAIYRYRKDGAVLLKYMPQFLVLGLLAGIVGPRLLLGINQTTVQHLIGVMLLLMLPVLWFKKDAGTINIIRSRHRKFIGFFVLAAVLIYTTMFGGGGGIFLIYTFVYFFGMTVTEANATGLVVALFATFVALITYINGHVVDWSIGIPLMLGGIGGGYIGAHIALKRGAEWVKIILTIIIIISGVKLLFW